MRGGANTLVAGMNRRLQYQETLESPSLPVTPVTWPGDVIGDFLALPELRGLWVFSSVNESGSAIDLSGQGRTLTNNGGIPRAVLPSGLPYCTLNGTTQYWSRADEAGIDITGPLTMGTWVYWSTLSNRWCMAKFNGSTNQRAYALSTSLSGSDYLYSCLVSAAGTASFGINSSPDIIVANRLSFMAMRYVPSTELALFVNKKKYTTTVGVPASIHNSNAALTFGRTADGAPMDGGLAIAFLSAAAISDESLDHLYEKSLPLMG